MPPAMKTVSSSIITTQAPDNLLAYGISANCRKVKPPFSLISTVLEPGAELPAKTRPTCELKSHALYRLETKFLLEIVAKWRKKFLTYPS